MSWLLWNLGAVNRQDTRMLFHMHIDEGVYIRGMHASVFYNSILPGATSCIYSWL
jgi:hypothetical protein